MGSWKDKENIMKTSWMDVQEETTQILGSKRFNKVNKYDKEVIKFLPRESNVGASTPS